MKLPDGFIIIFHFSVVSSYIDINANINVNADDFISSSTFNKRDGSFAKLVNRVLLRINSFIITYAVLTLLRTFISRIST
jgi:hypothetical protein